VAAGALEYEAALAIVAERGRAMQAAADLEASGMAALLGADVALADAVCEANAAAGGRLVVANDNAPDQVVVAGSLSDLDWLDAHGRELGVRRAIRLKVAGAFHSPFMEPAAGRVRTAVNGVRARRPAFPVYANVTAAPVEDHRVRELLAVQMVSPVRFTETLTNMATAGIDTFVHVGPGVVTAGMAKRTVAWANVVVVNELAGIPEAVAAIG
jgi:[acyl-carrier-protein] S-malonyltransferase